MGIDCFKSYYDAQFDKTYLEMRYVLSVQNAEKCACISPHFVL